MDNKFNINRKENQMEDCYKEVYFNQYCKDCKYAKMSEDGDPCFDCLNEPVNLYSHKPVKYEEKKNDR